MTPLISIIIPVYNRAHLISETLDSILAQTFKNWECIIVDDGSTDKTKEVVSEYVDKDGRFHFYTRPVGKIKGPNSCRNFGFEKSKGEFINWFDSDDLLLPTALEERLNSFEENTDVVIAKAEFFDSVTGHKISENQILSDNLLVDYFTGKITYYVSGPMWKKKFLLQQESLFDERITYLDDWDFNLRMIYQSPKIKFLNKILFRYRSHQNSLSKQVDYFNIVELKSEYYARNKQLNVLLKKKLHLQIIEDYMFYRYKSVLREAIIINKSRYFFFKEYFKLCIRYGYFKKGLSVMFGFVSYFFFNRGSFLVK